MSKKMNNTVSNETVSNETVNEVSEVIDDPIVYGSVDGFYLTQSESDEFVKLEGDEAKRANEYRKECMKKNVHPIPPSQWLVCPACGYRAPESLNTHITRVHGGINKLAHELGVLPETIKVTAPELRDRNATISRRIAAEKKAAKEAAKEAVA